MDLKTDPTQRSLKVLRERGFTCGIVEKWNSHVMVRQDLFGFADIIAMKPGDGIWAVQVTTSSNVAAHRAKIYGEPRHQVWLKSGGQIWLHGWSKKGARGKRKLWTLTEEIL